jgi:hypothetical protein
MRSGFAEAGSEHHGPIYKQLELFKQIGFRRKTLDCSDLDR